MAAFFALVVAQVKAYFAANAIAAILKVLPFAVFFVACVVEWATGSVFGHLQAIALVVSAVVLTLELAGKIPTITLPATPVTPVAPKVLPLP